MEQKSIYSKQTIEFVTVATEFCSFIENGSSQRKEFTDKCIKILPLLYLKALLLPKTDDEDIDDNAETFVSEEIYQYVRVNIERIMGEKDDYLEVFADDMQYSENPIPAYISEDIADIYQDIKNFISLFALEYEPTMENALMLLIYNFRTYWSQKLVNVLRPLNKINFSVDEEDDDLFQNEKLSEGNDSGDWLFSNQRNLDLDPDADLF